MMNASIMENDFELEAIVLKMNEGRSFHSDVDALIYKLLESSDQTTLDGVNAFILKSTAVIEILKAHRMLLAAKKDGRRLLLS